jgi:hypothetical protein
MMTPELQSVVDRLELVERQNRGLRALSLIAVLIALAAVAAPLLIPRPKPPDTARFSAVEANRFLLRDATGKTAGGMEVDRQGTIKLVLGGGYGGSTGAAFLEVQPNGASHLTLRGTDGGVRASLIGSRSPSLSISPDGTRSSVALTTLPDGSGSLFVTNAQGRTRFRAP